MPLPTLPQSYQQSAYEQLVRSLPVQWFGGLDSKESPLHPVLWGMALAIAYVQLAYDLALNAAIPMLSAGVWLNLHLQSIGVKRGKESDAEAKERYAWEFKPTRNTRAGELEALKKFTGLEPPRIRLEGDRSIGRYGQFRLVIDDVTQPWNEGINYGFLGEFIRRYVSAGIIPAVDINLKCLLYRSLPAWQFSDHFPMSYNVQGLVWQRPAFAVAERLSVARSLIAQTSIEEWRDSRDDLLSLYGIYRSASVEAIGSVFVYLTDAGKCPFLAVDWDLNLNSQDINQTFPIQPFAVDGWHFYDKFLWAGAVRSGLVAPNFEVPAPTFIVGDFALLAIEELNEIYDLPVEQAVGDDIFQYGGLSFSLLRVTEFYPAAPPSSNPVFTSPELEVMKSGLWKLKLSEGLERWGDFPPLGNTDFVGTPIANLDPVAIWWSDSRGEARSRVPIWDGEAIYLAIEFLLSRGADRTIRELELSVNGDRVNYRRFSFPVNSLLNSGFTFLVRALP